MKNLTNRATQYIINNSKFFVSLLIYAMALMLALFYFSESNQNNLINKDGLRSHETVNQENSGKTEGLLKLSKQEDSSSEENIEEQKTQPVGETSSPNLDNAATYQKLADEAGREAREIDRCLDIHDKAYEEYTYVRGVAAEERRFLIDKYFNDPSLTFPYIRKYSNIAIDNYNQTVSNAWSKFVSTVKNNNCEPFQSAPPDNYPKID